jgi:Ankyrin repeats (3 copies)
MNGALIAAVEGHWHRVCGSYRDICRYDEESHHFQRRILSSLQSIGRGISDGITLFHIICSDMFKISPHCQQVLLEKGIEFTRSKALSWFITHAKEGLDESKFRQIINQTNSDGMTFVHTAALGGYLSIFHNLVDLDVQTQRSESNVLGFNMGDMMKTPTGDGRNILHFSAAGGHVDLLIYLVYFLSCYSELSLGCCNNKGWNVVHFACVHGHANVVTWLARHHRHQRRRRRRQQQQQVDNNKDLVTFEILKRDTDGKSALDLAIENGQLEIVVWFMTDESLPMMMMMMIPTKPITKRMQMTKLSRKKYHNRYSGRFKSNTPGSDDDTSSNEPVPGIPMTFPNHPTPNIVFIPPKKTINTASMTVNIFIPSICVICM